MLIFFALACGGDSEGTCEGSSCGEKSDAVDTVPDRAEKIVEPKEVVDEVPGSFEQNPTTPILTDGITPEEALAILKDPRSWTNWNDHTRGFGPQTGLVILDSYCLSWTLSSEHYKATNHYQIQVVSENEIGSVGRSYVYICSRKPGVYRLVAIPTAGLDENGLAKESYANETLFEFERDPNVLLDVIKTGNDWTFMFSGSGSDYKCNGFSQVEISNDSFCKSWQFNGDFQTYFDFKLLDAEGAVIDTGSYLSSCERDIDSYVVKAVSKATGETTTLHTVSRVVSGKDPALHCSTPLATNKPEDPPTTNYKVTWHYKIGETYPNYYCQTDGQNSFENKTKTTNIAEAEYLTLLNRNNCSFDLSTDNSLNCVYTENCRTVQSWCEKGNVWEGSYRSGSWDLTVCSEPSF